MKKLFKETFESNIVITESLSDEGNKYRCIIIKAGQTVSANNICEVDGKKILVSKNYLSEALREAVENKIFEGAPALFRSVGQHLAAENTGVNSYIGNFSEVSFNEDSQQVEATLTIVEINPETKSFKQQLSSLFQSGCDIGLSIVGVAEYAIEKIKDGYCAIITKFTGCQSVDIVPKGNAGGKLLQIIESQIKLTESMNPETKQKIYDFLYAAGLIAPDKSIELINDEDLLFILWQHTCTLNAAQETTLTEAQKTEQQNTSLLLTDGMKQAGKSMSDILREFKLVSSGNMLSMKLAESNLPVPVRDKVKKQYSKIVLSEAEIAMTIAEESNTLAALNPSHINNGEGDIRGGEDQIDKIQKQLTWILMPSQQRMKLSVAEQEIYKNVRAETSFRELYTTFTGDKTISGKVGKMSLAESVVSTTWPEILGNAMHTVLLKIYSTSAFNQMDWKLLADVVTLTDFKDNKRVRLGGYADLPAVSENAAYTAATTPGEEGATYKLLKYGYTETVSREAILNDNLQAIQRIPKAWGVAAARTLYKYVWNLILSNPTMGYDSTALFHANHKNLMSDTLDATSLNTAILKLADQTELSSVEKIGLTPEYLIVSNALRNVAYGLVTPAAGLANNVPNYIQSQGIKPIVVTHMTDLNDWYLAAAPSQMEAIEVGFLNGNEEPELFVQEDPRQGYAFSNDGIKYKIRHEYAGLTRDHRPLVASKPA